MRIRYALAALSVAVLSVSAIAAPSSASAETTIIKKVTRDHGPRAEMHRDRGMHRMHRGGDRVVIIKKHHRY